MKLTNLNAIVSIIAGIIACVTGMYAINKPTPVLTAYVTDRIFYTPPQYDKLMLDIIDKSDYNKIYDRIDNIAKNAGFEEKSKLADEIRKSILSPFNSPFQYGLEEYRKLIFISLYNSGGATAKNIYIDYPEKVLVMVEDDKKDKIEKPDTISRLTIPSIRQSGNYRIWAWAKSDKFDKKSIIIGNEEQIAKIEYGEIHFGTASYLASFYENNERIIKTIFIMLIFLVTMLVCYHIFNFMKSMLKTK
ncbi:hypothetical protein [Enterobacter sp.]|uniref:hypothetical protein n=1 Tax=Enterobacter sp. TaxID=42895 RepID=UPI0031E3827E